jgi:hypothetical protein
MVGKVVCRAPGLLFLSGEIKVAAFCRPGGLSAVRIACTMKGGKRYAVVEG